VTAHRRESFGKGFDNLCHGIRKLADESESVRIIYPVHPNPNVREPVRSHLGNHPRILLCDPIPYISFIELMQRADLLLTDSGGIQEEGPTLRKPILVMRETTERPEGVQAGFSKLIGTDPDLILQESLNALKNGSSGKGQNPYGDGHSSARILSEIERAMSLPHYINPPLQSTFQSAKLPPTL
jgi:UDP-N-acetylglucosamine 2-epimerase